MFHRDLLSETGLKKNKMEKGDRDCVILLHAAQPQLRHVAWQHVQYLVMPCGSLQGPSLAYRPPILITSCLFLCNWYLLPFARRKLNAIPWLKQCHFFPLMSPCQMLYLKRIFIVCKFSSAAHKLIDPLWVKGRVPGKGRILFCLFKTNTETQVLESVSACLWELWI